MHAGAAHNTLAALFFRKSKAIVTRLLACPVAANEPAALAVSWAQTPEECWGEAQAETEGWVVVSRVVCQDSSWCARDHNPSTSLRGGVGPPDFLLGSGLFFSEHKKFTAQSRIQIRIP